MEKSIIIDALNYYNNLNINENINTNTDIKFTNELFNLIPTIYIKENDKFVKKVYNIIGIYNTENQVFTWAWATNIEKREHIKTNQLVLHAINMNNHKNLSEMYIKKILSSSSIKIESEYLLNIILAISNYLTKTNGTISFNESNCIIYYGLYDIQDIEEIIAEPEIKL